MRTRNQARCPYPSYTLALLQKMDAVTAAGQVGFLQVSVYALKAVEVIYDNVRSKAR